MCGGTASEYSNSRARRGCGRAGSGFGAGASLASDDASNATYASGWATGSATTTTGTWGGGWTFTTTNGDTGQNGRFTGTSTGNDQGISGLTSINTGGRAWAMYSNSGTLVTADRPLDGALLLKQSIQFSLDNGNIGNGNKVGVQLMVGSTVAFEFRFVGGETNYSLYDGGGVVTTSLGFSLGGVSAQFDKVGLNSYNFTATRKETNTVYTLSNRTFAGGSGGVTSIRFFNSNAGAGGSNNAYFNSIAVIPEPGALALLGSGLLLSLRRRK
ncbi:MAG: PEP-CTERM sorting domain-containing protein [Tepidisphaeraceae bacterium]